MHHPCQVVLQYLQLLLNKLPLHIHVAHIYLISPLTFTVSFMGFQPCCITIKHEAIITDFILEAILLYYRVNLFVAILYTWWPSG